MSSRLHGHGATTGCSHELENGRDGGGLTCCQGEYGQAGQRGGDGDSDGNGRRLEKDEKNIIYYTRDFPN